MQVEFRVCRFNTREDLLWSQGASKSSQGDFTLILKTSIATLFNWSCLLYCLASCCSQCWCSVLVCLGWRHYGSGQIIFGPILDNYWLFSDWASFFERTSCTRSLWFLEAIDSMGVGCSQICPEVAYAYSLINLLGVKKHRNTGRTFCFNYKND